MADHRSKAALAGSAKANEIAAALNALTKTLAAADIVEQLRSRRATFAADYILWINTGAVHLVSARVGMQADRVYVDEGRRLRAQA